MSTHLLALSCPVSVFRHRNSKHTHLMVMCKHCVGFHCHSLVLLHLAEQNTDLCCSSGRSNCSLFQFIMARNGAQILSFGSDRNVLAGGEAVCRLARAGLSH